MIKLKIIYSLILTLFWGAITSHLSAQTSMAFLPKNLDKSTLIVIEYDTLPYPYNPDSEKIKGIKAVKWNKSFFKFQKSIDSFNAAVPAANQMLHEKMKAYPFDYVIIKPEELAPYSSKTGYYILRGPATKVDLGPDAADFQYAGEQVLHAEINGYNNPNVHVSGPNNSMSFPRYYFSLLDFSKGKGYFFRSNFKAKGEILLPNILDQVIKKLKKKSRHKG